MVATVGILVKSTTMIEPIKQNVEVSDSDKVEIMCNGKGMTLEQITHQIWTCIRRNNSWKELEWSSRLMLPVFYLFS